MTMTLLLILAVREVTAHAATLARAFESLKEIISPLMSALKRLCGEPCVWFAVPRTRERPAS